MSVVGGGEVGVDCHYLGKSSRRCSASLSLGRVESSTEDTYSVFSEGVEIILASNVPRVEKKKAKMSQLLGH